MTDETGVSERGPRRATGRRAARFAILFAGCSGFITVALGAWAVHGLARQLDAVALAWIETGLRYQGLHAVALIGVAGLLAIRPARALAVAALAFALGTLLFSGGLYALAFTGLRPLAHLTPIGGLAFLAGWAGICWYGIGLGSGKER